MMRRELAAFFAALGFFTRLPVPAWVGYSAEAMQAAPRYLPAIGLLVGGLSAAVYLLAHGAEFLENIDTLAEGDARVCGTGPTLTLNGLTPAAAPLEYAWAWAWKKEGRSAWIITVTADDLAKDGLEADSGSDPMVASSLPPLYRGLPSGATGEDVNGNGLSDVWEQWIRNFGLSSTNDDDGDGMTNGAEALAGTNPLDPRSRLWSEVVSAGGSLTVCWPVLPWKRAGRWWWR